MTSNGPTPTILEISPGVTNTETAIELSEASQASVSRALLAPEAALKRNIFTICLEPTHCKVFHTQETRVAEPYQLLIPSIALTTSLHTKEQNQNV